MALFQHRGPSLATSRPPPPTTQHEASQGATQGGTRLRKRLQKSSSKQQKNDAAKRPGSGASKDDKSMENKPAGANKLAVRQAHPPPPPAPLPIPRPPDLSDSKWAEYLRRSGFLCALDKSCMQHPRAFPLLRSCNDHHKNDIQPSPPRVVPELAHLLAGGSNPQRPSKDNDSNSKPPGSLAPANSSGRMRRRAKTPVLAIGQLEHAIHACPVPALPTSAHAQQPAQQTVQHSLPQPVQQHKHEEVQSAERLAEEYRALLQSRNSILTESHSEPPPSRQEDYGLPKLRRQHSFDGLVRTESISAPGDASPPRPSLESSDSPATSSDDDGTLVSFEEETIYFKPMSFSPPLSPAPNSQPHDYHDFHPVLSSPLQSPTQASAAFQRHSPTTTTHASAAASPTPDSLSLQICLDLLTRELSSAVSGRRQYHPSHQRSTAEVSSLQVWAMIEAYERLRSQLLFSDVGNGDGHHGQDHPLLPSEELRRPVEMVFDVWLRALYAIHDSLAYGAASGGGAEADERRLSDSDLDLDVVLQSEDLD